MTVLRTAEAIKYMALVVLASLALCGCGGSPGSIDNTSGTSPVPKSPDQQTRSVKLNSYGSWLLVNPIYKSDPDKLQAALQTMAKYDTAVLLEQEWINNTPGWDKLSVTSLKRLNPNIKVYGYYRCAKASFEPDWGKEQDQVPENASLGCPIPYQEIKDNDWWLRDGNGNIVAAGDSSNNAIYHFLDLGKPGLKERFLECLLERMKATGVDGVVFDYLPPQLTVGWFAIPGGWFAAYPMPKAYPTDQDWLEKSFTPFVNHVSDGLHAAGYKVVGLCMDYSFPAQADQFYRTKIDATIYEVWAVYPDGNWLASSTAARKISDFANDPLECWITDAGIRTGDPEYEQKYNMSLAMYYIATPALDVRHTYHHKGPGVVFWEPIWDFYIGTPAESAVKVEGKYFWSRKYTDGLVLLNFEEKEDMTYTLDGTYQDYKGKIFSGKITLPPHTALILANSN